MNKEPKVIEIPREQAVFRLDGNGRWHNRFGRFEKKKIIDHFNRAIQRDEKGYFVGRTNGDVREKVYFHFEDTALFVFDIRVFESKIELILNTERMLVLDPECLWIENDNLYTAHGGERIKFSERALTKIVRWMDDKGGESFIRVGGGVYRVPDRDGAGG